MSDTTLPSIVGPGRLLKRLSGGNSEFPEAPDERGLLMLSVTIVLMVVLSIIVATMMTTAIGQLQLSSNSTNRNGALQGALAGVQAMVANIRAASTSGSPSYVVLDQLPCNNITGETNTANSASFVVSVDYQDLTSQGTYSTVSCTQGQGPAAAAQGNALARAIIVSCSPSSACPTNPLSAPTGSAIWRRVVSTYDFNTSYQNIPGGLIYSYSGDECFEVNTTSDVLQVTTSCSTGNADELFQYTTNWNLAIQIGNSIYCIQDPEDGSSPSSSPVTISTSCASGGAEAQWGINDSGGIEGVATTGSPAGQPNGYCLANPNPSDTANTTANATVENTDCDDGFDNTATWHLSPEVGAGGSQPPSGQVFGATGQLVNFEEFGDCLDVTNQDSDPPPPFLIDYMCKQFPDTTDYPTWNQRWCFYSPNSSNVGLLYTPVGQTSCSSPSTPYCLESPLEPASQYPSAYVNITASTIGEACNLSASMASQPTNLLWTEWGDNGGLTHEYTWTDNDGYCLEANTANPQAPPGNNDEFTTIQVDTCDGSYEQKWNAPAIFGESQITNTHEGTGNGSVTLPQ